MSKHSYKWIGIVLAILLLQGIGLATDTLAVALASGVWALLAPFLVWCNE